MVDGPVAALARVSLVAGNLAERLVQGQIVADRVLGTMCEKKRQNDVKCLAESFAIFENLKIWRFSNFVYRLKTLIGAFRDSKIVLCSVRGEFETVKVCRQDSGSQLTASVVR